LNTTRKCKTFLQMFYERDMETLLLRSITPKLAMVLRLFEINPADQKLEPLNWVFPWAKLLPTDLYVSLWVDEFFPKWLETLYLWLTHSPDLSEIMRWYNGWKGILEHLLRFPEIEDQFRRGLDMMNQLIAGDDS